MAANLHRLIPLSDFCPKNSSLLEMMKLKKVESFREPANRNAYDGQISVNKIQACQGLWSGIR